MYFHSESALDDANISIASSGCAEDSALFLDRLGQASSVLTLHQLLKSFLNSLGISAYTYLAFNPPNAKFRTHVATTYPVEWVEQYLDQDYFHIDPVMRLLRQQNQPFTWATDKFDSSLSNDQKQLLKEAGDFGFSHWITVPIHNPRQNGGFLIAAFQDARSVRQVFDSTSRYNLMLGTLYFHHALAAKHGRESPHLGSSLTSMEREILAWISAGKNVWEVSEVLALPLSEVKKYIARAGERLGTFGTVSTVAKAFTLGHLKS